MHKNRVAVASMHANLSMPVCTRCERLQVVECTLLEPRHITASITACTCCTCCIMRPIFSVACVLCSRSQGFWRCINCTQLCTTARVVAGKALVVTREITQVAVTGVLSCPEASGRHSSAADRHVVEYLLAPFCSVVTGLQHKPTRTTCTFSSPAAWVAGYYCLLHHPLRRGGGVQ